MDNRKIPAPFYAAAGAGDRAYRKLRAASERLVGSARGPQAAPLSEQVDQLRTRGRAAGADVRADLNRLADLAQRKAEQAQVRAQQIQERAARYYHELVVHGEQVVRTAEQRRNGAAGTTGTAGDPDATVAIPAGPATGNLPVPAVEPALTAEPAAPVAPAGTTATTEAATTEAIGTTEPGATTAGTTKPIKRTRPAARRTPDA